MVISREEALAGENFPKNPKRHLEKLIEDKILEMKASKGKITGFSVSIPGNINIRALGRIIRKYEKDDWKVKYNPSTEPSSTLEFS